MFLVVLLILKGITHRSGFPSSPFGPGADTSTRLCSTAPSGSKWSTDACMVYGIATNRCCAWGQCMLKALHFSGTTTTCSAGTSGTTIAALASCIVAYIVGLLGTTTSFRRFPPRFPLPPTTITSGATSDFSCYLQFCGYVRRDQRSTPDCHHFLRQRCILRHHHCLRQYLHKSRYARHKAIAIMVTWSWRRRQLLPPLPPGCTHYHQLGLPAILIETTCNYLMRYLLRTAISCIALLYRFRPFEVSWMFRLQLPEMNRRHNNRLYLHLRTRHHRHSTIYWLHNGNKYPNTYNRCCRNWSTCWHLFLHCFHQAELPPLPPVPPLPALPLLPLAPTATAAPALPLLPPKAWH